MSSPPGELNREWLLPPMMRRWTIAVLVVAVGGGSFLVYRTLRRSPHPLGVSGSSPVSASGLLRGPYFSDSDRVAEQIVGAINSSRSEIDAAMYDLTEPGIAGALEAAARRGVRVRLVADRQQAREPHSEVPDLRARGIPVRLSGGYRGSRSLMHDKFALFDGALAVTGSFNWTTSAEDFNFENALFVRDPDVVARYRQEFERIWAQAE